MVAFSVNRNMDLIFIVSSHRIKSLIQMGGITSPFAFNKFIKMPVAFTQFEEREKKSEREKKNSCQHERQPARLS